MTHERCELTGVVVFCFCEGGLCSLEIHVWFAWGLRCVVRVWQVVLSALGPVRVELPTGARAPGPEDLEERHARARGLGHGPLGGLGHGNRCPGAS